MKTVFQPAFVDYVGATLAAVPLILSVVDGVPMARSAAVALCAAFLAPLALSGQQRDSQSSDWRRGAVCYEVFVRSFYDSDGHRVGDLNGLTQKLDYINDGNPRAQRDLG